MRNVDVGFVGKLTVTSGVTTCLPFWDVGVNTRSRSAVRSVDFPSTIRRSAVNYIYITQQPAFSCDKD